MSDICLDSESRDRRAVTTIYILYLLSLTLLITCIFGIVMAYRDKEKVSELWRSHIEFQIRTFWIGLILLALNGGIAITLTGLGTLSFFTIWMVARCCKGAWRAGAKLPIENPRTLFW